MLKYKQQPQCIVTASNMSLSSPYSTKTFKVLIALLFLTYAKKVLYYSLTPLRKCVRVCSFFLCTWAFLELKKKKKIILSIDLRIETTVIEHIPYTLNNAGLNTT